MKKAISAVVAAVFFGGSAWAAVRIVPLDGLTKVDPISGKSIVGVGRQGDTAWQEANPAWDGKSVLLSGARGESLAFQLVILRSPEDAIEDVKIALRLEGVEKVKLSRSWCIWNSPEIAVPLDGTKYTFDLPSKTPIEEDLFTNTPCVALSAWVEFTVPRKAAAGAMAGAVEVSAKAGLPAVSLPVLLRVSPFEIPARPRLIVEMNSYGDYGQFLSDRSRGYMQFQKLMREYRCTFLEVPYNQGGAVTSFLAPGVKGKDPIGPSLDWTRFDANLGGLFDGSAFDDGEPVSHFMLPLCYNWPAPFSQWTENREEYDRINVAVRRQIARHIADKGWTRTVFQEFHNENPSAGAKLPWHLDEPRSSRDMKGHDVYLALYSAARKDFPAGVRFDYRLDVSAWQNIRPDLERLAPQIGDWIVSWDPKYLNRDSAQMFRRYADANRGLFFAYGEIDGFNAGKGLVNWSVYDKYARSCWEWNCDGYEQWMVDMWKTKPMGAGFRTPVPPSSVPLVYSSGAGMRDLAWPGTHFGIDGPLPSLRLIAIRESLNLVDYAHLALAKHPDRKAEIDAALAAMKVDTAMAHFETKAKLAKMLSE